MESTFTWLDASEGDRRQALDVIDLFRERNTRDELGLGTIRDGLADVLFPGTSTVQTRARYMLFVPWIFRGLERRRVASARFAARARQAEIALIEPLARRPEEGVIGVEARAGLKRLPSSIYWQALGSWGIRRFPGSVDQYARSLDAFYRRVASSRGGDDGQAVDDNRNANWDPALPEPPADFPAEASLRLLPEEGDYLRHRILVEHPDTLLAFLVQRPPWRPTSFAWEHPDLGGAPERNRDQVHHARCLSELVQGARLLYNLMLAEAAGQHELIDHYEGRLSEWSGAVRARWSVLERWARAEVGTLWRHLPAARVPVQARVFVEAWLAQVRSGGPESIAGSAAARTLVREREVSLKRGRARLENPTALAQWGGAAGAGRLDFRWGVAQTLLLDIVRPLWGPVA